MQDNIRHGYVPVPLYTDEYIEKSSLKNDICYRI